MDNHTNLIGSNEVDLLGLGATGNDVHNRSNSLVLNASKALDLVESVHLDLDSYLVQPSNTIFQNRKEFLS